MSTHPKRLPKTGNTGLRARTYWQDEDTVRLPQRTPKIRGIIVLHKLASEFGLVRSKLSFEILCA